MALQFFLQSPELEIPTRALSFQNPNPNFSLHDLKSSLFPHNHPTHSSLFFTVNGKLLSDSTPLLQNPQITPQSTLTLHFRLNGGGGDGGSTCAESRDCFLNMYKGKEPDKADPNEMRLSRWVNCSLSNEPLKHPVVIDKLGNLFNKEALVEGLLKKSLPKQFGYIKGLKDMIAVELAEISDKEVKDDVKFQCPITGQDFNGKYKFFAIKSCGHVLSAKGLKEVKSPGCLVCHKEFSESDKIVINGTEEEVKELWDKLKEQKAAKVKDSTGKKSKVEETGRLIGSKHKNEADDTRSNGNGLNGLSKKLKPLDGDAPEKAKSAVYKSIFTSSKKKSDFRETYSCRSLPLGRN